MADLDWAALGRNAEQFATMPLPRTSEPPPVQPMTAQQENAVAQTVLPQTGNVSVSTPPMQPQAQTVTAQPQPAGMVPMQVTQQVIPKALQKRHEQALAHQQAAVDSVIAAETAQNNAIAEQRRFDANYLAQQNAQAEAQQAADNAKRDQAMTDLQKAVDDYNANRTVNPNRAYERMGVGGRILATIGQAFGAFGSAITHSPNYAQQMIERAIDADIKSQEGEIAARGNAINMATNRVAMFRQRGLDNQAAFAAAKLSYLQQSQAKIDEIIANTKNPLIAAKGAELKAGLEQRALDTMLEHGKMAITSAPAGAVGARSFEEQRKLRELEVDVPQTDPKTGKSAGYKTLLAKSPQDAEKVRGALAIQNQIKKNLTTLRTFMDKTTIHSVGKNALQIKKITQDLATQFGVLRGLGALSDKDYEVASQIGDPSSFLQRDKTTYELIDNFSGRIDGMVESELRGRGLIH